MNPSSVEDQPTVWLELPDVHAPGNPPETLGTDFNVFDSMPNGNLQIIDIERFKNETPGSLLDCRDRFLN